MCIHVNGDILDEGKYRESDLRGIRGSEEASLNDTLRQGMDE